ncbi:hypothetical protein JCM5350_006732 [Sporobolomyces pararoseus]
MTSILPYDILRTIYDHVDAKEDLARACLVSKELLSIAQPLLYASVKIILNEGMPYRVFPRDPNYLGSHFYYSLDSTSSRLISTLRNNQSLASLVFRLTLEATVVGEYELATSQSNSIDPATLLVELLNHASSVKTVVLDNLSYVPEVDRAVRRFQTSHRTGGSPRFRFIARGSVRKLIKLEGAYEGFELVSFSRLNRDLDAHKFLGESRKSLRRLSIPFDDTTSLSLFPSLETLSFLLPGHGPFRIVRNLTEALSPLTNLRLLILRTLNGQFSQAPILSDTRLPDLLPPLLTHLSFDFNVPTTSLAMFLNNLPGASSLHAVNCLREKGGELEFDEAEVIAREQNEQDLVSKFAERSIQLYYDEEWSVW